MARKDREVDRAKSREYNRVNRDRLREYKRQWEASQPNYHRKQNLRTKFNMTMEQYAIMNYAQNGLCFVCAEPGYGANLCVDHDRSCCPGDNSCGKCVRGLLCQKCNTAEGLLRGHAENLVRYLSMKQVS